MDREGPILEVLTRRLAECPSDFLAEPLFGKAGVVDVAAAVSDLLVRLGGEPLSAQEVGTFRPGKGQRRAHRNRLRLTLLSAWLFHDPSFREAREHAPAVLAFLRDDLAAMQEVWQAEHVVLDPDRREELVRRGLGALGLRPAGETREQAEDRLTTLDSLER